MTYTKEEVKKFVEICMKHVKEAEGDNIIKYFIPDEVVVSDDLQSTDIYVTIEKRYMNAIGSTHGAFIAGFLDHWMGVSARIFGEIDYDKIGVTTADYQLNFLRATKAGDRLRCHVECCHAGKRAVITRATVYCEGKIVVIATQNMAIISPTKTINNGK